MNRFLFLLLIAGSFTFASCKQRQDAKAGPAPWVEMDAKGKMRCCGKVTTIDDLPQVLGDTLRRYKLKHGALPEEILPEFSPEILMGTRGAVMDAVGEAIEIATAR